MAVLGVGPVGGMQATSGKAHGKAGGKGTARPAAAPSPSYYVEEGAPVEASNWLKSLLQAGAIRLSRERIAALLNTEGKKAESVPGEARKERPAAPKASNRDYQLFKQAVALEEADAEAREAESAGGWRFWYGPALMAVVAVVFLLTVMVLDAVFGTRVLAALLPFLG